MDSTADSPLDKEANLADFMACTGADMPTALQFLEVTNWRLEESVNLYMESGGQQNRFAEPPSVSDTNIAITNSVVAETSSNYNSYINQNILEEEEDDDEDLVSSTDTVNSLEYTNADGIRAPDPSTRQRLTGRNEIMDQSGNIGITHGFYSGAARHVHDAFRDFAAESAVMAEQVGGSGNMEIENNLTPNLTTLYRPPLGLIYHGHYLNARNQAKSVKRWLLLNIQDEGEFSSHLLNRDTWSNDVVQNIVASGFVFWQNYQNSDDGKKICSLYQLTKKSLPSILIVDPRTGEKIVEWTGFIEATELAEKLTDFCDKNSFDNSSTRLKKVKPSSLKSFNKLHDESEEAQLAAAIAASMETHDMKDSTGKQEDNLMEVVDEIIPDEPLISNPEATKVQIRTADGKKIVRRILKSDPISILFKFVRNKIPEAKNKSFQLRTSRPPVSIIESESSVLDEGLCNESLIMQWM